MFHFVIIHQENLWNKNTCIIIALLPLQVQRQIQKHNKKQGQGYGEGVTKHVNSTKEKTLGEEKKTTLQPKLLIVNFFVEPDGVGPFQFSLHVTPTNQPQSSFASNLTLSYWFQLQLYLYIKIDGHFILITSYPYLGPKLAPNLEMANIGCDHIIQLATHSHVALVLGGN